MKKLILFTLLLCAAETFPQQRCLFEKKSLMRGEKETLLVLRDRRGHEYYSKFIVTEENGKLMAVDVERRVNPGKYKIVATSDNKIYRKKIRVIIKLLMS